MIKKQVLPVLFVLIFLVSASGVMQANAISGSLPFVMIGTAESGTNLFTSTSESATNSLTSGLGTGDFFAIPQGTFFGPVIVLDASVSTGGGFSITNPTYGTFTANGGSILTQTPTFLNIELTGTFVPVPGAFPSHPGPGPVVAHVSFNQTGGSVSGSFTLASVPEPGTLASVGIGILGIALSLRHKLNL